MDNNMFIQIIALIMLIWILGISTAMFIMLVKGFALKPKGFTDNKPTVNNVITNQTDMLSATPKVTRADEVEDSFEEYYMPTAFDKRIEQMAEELRGKDTTYEVPLYDMPSKEYNPNIYSDVEIITDEYEKVAESKFK